MIVEIYQVPALSLEISKSAIDLMQLVVLVVEAPRTPYRPLLGRFR